MLQCVVPFHDPGRTEVALSPNRRDFAPIENGYEYLEITLLHTAIPAHGPFHGGTLVSVLGAEFYERSAALHIMRCRFNSTAVHAIFVSAGEVRCVAPGMLPGFAHLAVTSNLQDYTDPILFHYAAVRLLRVTPEHGPVSGGTVLQVIGLGPWPERAFCQIGMHQVSATIVSRFIISCVTPRRPAAYRHTPLTIVHTGAKFASTVTFEYTDDPELHSMHPYQGPAQGGTVVTLFGSKLDIARDIRCILGGKIATTQLRSPSRLLCITPVSAQPGPAHLVLSRSDSHAFESAHMQSATKFAFNYYPPFSVLHANPSHGPMYGGTVLTVVCDLVPPTSTPHCKLNFTIVEASRHLSYGLLCRVPPASLAGLRFDLHVSLEVSANLQDFTSDGITFEYQVTRLLEALPRNGPISGGTLLTVVGTGFLPQIHRGALLHSSLGCTFLSSAGSRITVQGSRHTESSLICPTPAMPSPTEAAINVHVHNATILAGFTFKFLRMAHISEIWPPLGPSAGGNRIQVRPAIADMPGTKLDDANVTFDNPFDLRSWARTLGEARI